MTAKIEDAFVAYGMAMGRVQALEQLMRIALGEHEVRRVQQAGGELDASFGSKSMKMDFGKLEQRICGKFQLDKADRQVMSDARGFRNYLAHDFWINHMGHLQTPRGAAIVVRHAKLFSRQIDRVANLVVAVTGVDAQRYSDFVAAQAGDPKTLATWEALLTDAEAVFDRTEAVRLHRDG